MDTYKVYEVGLGGKIFFKPNNLILMSSKSDVNNFES